MDTFRPHLAHMVPQNTPGIKIVNPDKIMQKI